MSILIASCAVGLETLVEEEVQGFGGKDIEVKTGVVTWTGELETGYRCCLWSRYSSRVFLQLATFTVDDTDMLYEKSLSFPWADHMNQNNSFAINCTISGKSTFNHSRFAALRVKDGLVDAFRNNTGERPSVKSQNPDIQFHLHIESQTASLSLDLSGESLHRRGYREASGRAPLKETLAAAIVAHSGWTKDKALIDPMCGTGTLLIEAALLFGDSAPGLSRNYFGFYGWRGHSSELWDELVAEAMEREETGLGKNWPLLIGYDCDPVVISSARKNIERAGLEEHIQIKQGELATLGAPGKEGMVLSNLPYGERLSEREMVTRLYGAFGRIMRQRFAGWDCGVFISNPELTDAFRLRWQTKQRLYNGSIACRLLAGRVEKEEEPFVWRLPDIDKLEFDQEQEFANRLKKNLKRMLKWATREEVSCFRVYDRDLPDYNFTVDFYSKWVHVQEYSAPKTIDPERAVLRLEQGVRCLKQILGVRSDRVFIKRRERQKGKKQYEKKANRKKMYEVREGHCSFLVNFTDYLDTGLFLDHRPIRSKIYQNSRGKRFLNLFGYTGTASVHAAMGGAENTTTVDLSPNYLNWARMNLALNGFAEGRHKVEKADCLQWLKESQSVFDLIFIDPPTFSNTKKEKRVFDIQKDHVELITAAMKRLEKEGDLYFSTNFKRFKMDKGLSETFIIKDISRESLPYDFSRNTRVHSCWEIKNKPDFTWKK